MKDLVTMRRKVLESSPPGRRDGLCTLRVLALDPVTEVAATT